MENKDKLNNEINQDFSNNINNSGQTDDANKSKEQTYEVQNQETFTENSESDASELIDEKQTEEKGEEEISEMEKLQNEINALKEEVNQWKDKFLRKMAEFENYKKRVAEDQLQLVKYSNEKLIKDLLPVIDDFERALTFSKEELKNNSVLQGVEMIYNKLMKILSDYGLKKIDAMNQPFDFNYHEALLQVPKDGVEPLTIIEEVEKGYLLNDKVIRHSKVIVASESSLQSSPNDNQNNNNEEVK
jgi:molecular chaperone GrpE